MLEPLLLPDFQFEMGFMVFIIQELGVIIRRAYLTFVNDIVLQTCISQLFHHIKARY